MAPPLLPNHPVRRRITPQLYPEIYTKIIVSARTPSVPINLRILTHALVQGWKADGEWPPKPKVFETDFVRRKSKEERSGENPIKHGVKAVGRALKLGVGGDVESQRIALGLKEGM